MALKGIAAVGECMIELSGSGESDSWRMGFAGDTLNTLWAIRALTDPERPADYVSAFGDDAFSARQVAFFQQHGIGIGSSPRIAGARPGLYAITLTGAERSFTYWRGDSAARRLASDVDALRKSLADRAIVYVSGITMAILEPANREILFEAIREARAAGSLVVFDPNYRPRLWPDAASARTAIDIALQITDIALPTFPDERELFGDTDQAATVARLRAAGVGEIVVKNGEMPALVAAADISTTVPGVDVAAPLDTTGAGDSFNGAYLAARLNGDAPVEAARRAHRVAAAVVQVRGALAPFETLKSAFAAA